MDGFCTAHHSSSNDYRIVSFGMGGSLVFRLSCDSTRKKCATFLSPPNGRNLSFSIVYSLIITYYKFDLNSIQAQTDDNERSPLLESYLNTIHHLGQTESSVANFYSPIDSAHNSDSEVDEDELYKNKAIADVHAAFELLECIDWKVEKIIPSTGDRIQSIQRKKFGKIYRLTVRRAKCTSRILIVIKNIFYFELQAQMNVSAKVLWQKLYFGIEEMPTWNPTVLEAKILKASSNEISFYLISFNKYDFFFHSIEN